MGKNCWCSHQNDNCLISRDLRQEIKKADEEIRTLDPLLGKEMLYH